MIPDSPSVLPPAHFVLERVGGAAPSSRVVEPKNGEIHFLGAVPLGENIVSWIQNQEGINPDGIKKVHADVARQGPAVRRFNQDGSFNQDWETAPLVFDAYNGPDGKRLLSADVFWHIDIEDEDGNSTTYLVKQTLFTSEEISTASAPGRRAAENTESKTRALVGIDSAAYVMKQGLYSLSSKVHPEQKATERAKIVRKASQAHTFQIDPKDLQKKELADYKIKLLDEDHKKIDTVKRTNEAFFEYIDAPAHPIPGGRIDQEAGQSGTRSLTRFEKNQLLSRYSIIQSCGETEVSEEDGLEYTFASTIEEDLLTPEELLDLEDSSASLRKYDFPLPTLKKATRSLRHKLNDQLAEAQNLRLKLESNAVFKLYQRRDGLMEQLNHLASLDPDDSRSRLADKGAAFLKQRSKGPSDNLRAKISQLEQLEQHIENAKEAEDINDGEDFDADVLKDLETRRSQIAEEIELQLRDDQEVFRLILNDASAAMSLESSDTLRAVLEANRQIATKLQATDDESPLLIRAKQMQIDYIQKLENFYQQELAFREQYRQEHGVDYSPGRHRYDARTLELQAQVNALADEIPLEEGIKQEDAANSDLQRLSALMPCIEDSQAKLRVLQNEMIAQLRICNDKRETAALAKEADSIEKKLRKTDALLNDAEDSISSFIETVTKVMPEPEDFDVTDSDSEDEDDYQDI